MVKTPTKAREESREGEREVRKGDWGMT